MAPPKKQGFPPGVVNVVNGCNPLARKSASKRLGVSRVFFIKIRATERFAANVAESPNTDLDDVDQAIRWVNIDVPQSWARHHLISGSAGARLDGLR